MTLQEFRRTISHRIEVGRKRRQLRREFAQLAAMGSLDVSGGCRPRALAGRVAVRGMRLFSTEETGCHAFCPNAVQLDYALLKQRPVHA